MITLTPPKIGLAGKFSLEVRKAATGQLVRRIEPFSNHILNQGLNWLGSRTVPGIAGVVEMSEFFVGTSTTAPTNTDIEMGGTWRKNDTIITNNATNLGAPDYVASWTSTKRWTAGSATGTWTSVGVGAYSATGPVNRLFSRALIVDGGGSPVSITVLSDEYLDVTYTLELHAVTGDFSGSFDLSGVTYNYTGRRSYANLWSLGMQWHKNNLTLSVDPAEPTVPHHTIYYPAGLPSAVALGPITDTITNAIQLNLAGVTYSNASYVAGSYTTTCTETYGLSIANHANGIIGFSRGLSGGGSSNYPRSGWQILLDKVIPKTSSKILELTWSASWGRKP